MDANIGPIVDPSVSFKATKKLKSFFKEHKEEIKKYKKNPVPKTILELGTSKDVSLSVTDVEWLHSFLKDKRTDFKPLTGSSLDREIYNLLESEDFSQCLIDSEEDRVQTVYLHELLESADFQLPKNEVIPRNPILAARVEKLKKEQEEREYRAMTRNIDASRVIHMKDDSIGYQLNMMNRHLIAVGQFIISVAAGFAFGFLGVELLLGGLDFGFRLLLGIACALTIALAEFYFLAKHLSNEESAMDDTSREPLQRNTLRNGKPHKD